MLDVLLLCGKFTYYSYEGCVRKNILWEVNENQCENECMQSLIYAYPSTYSVRTIFVNPFIVYSDKKKVTFTVNFVIIIVSSYFIAGRI